MEYLKDWNRETSILFASMILGSYAWIVSERIFFGTLAGVCTFLMLSALYEATGRFLGLPHLSYVVEFERTYLPRIMRLVPRSRLKRQV